MSRDAYVDLEPARMRRWTEWTDQQRDGQVVSSARVVGNRSDEAIVADRERRLAEIKRRELQLLHGGKQCGVV